MSFEVYPLTGSVCNVCIMPSQPAVFWITIFWIQYTCLPDLLPF